MLLTSSWPLARVKVTSEPPAVTPVPPGAARRRSDQAPITSVGFTAPKSPPRALPQTSPSRPRWRPFTNSNGEESIRYEDTLGPRKHQNHQKHTVFICFVDFQYFSMPESLRSKEYFTGRPPNVASNTTKTIKNILFSYVFASKPTKTIKNMLFS